MATIYWGFYLHVEGMKLGTSAEKGVGPGSFSVEGPSYVWGGAGAGGCYVAINYDGKQTIYPLILDYVSIQGQGFITPATQQQDTINPADFGNLNSFENARFTIEVHQYATPSNGWKDVPSNIKMTAPHGTGSGQKEKVILERNQLVSLKGRIDTATIARGRLGPPIAFNQKRWDACFGRI
jgi:hypothetical protein